MHCYGSEKKADLMWEQPVQWLCRGAPTVEHILMANKTVKEIKATPDVELRVLPLEPHQAIWMSVADASMANVESKSQGGLIIALVDKVVQTGAAGDFSINSWRSHRLRRVVKATLGSEALAMDDALAELEWIRALWCEVMNKDSCVLDGARLGGDESILAVRVKDDEPALHVTDAKALHDLLQRRSGNAGRCRRAQIDVSVICVSARALKCSTHWVPGELTVADPVTKRNGKKQFHSQDHATGEVRHRQRRATSDWVNGGPPEGCQ